MKQVFTTTNEVELQMLVGLLESKGITSNITADGSGDYFRTLGADNLITKRVLVDDNDWESAVEIAKEQGFFYKKSIERSKSEIICARSVLVIFTIILIILFFL